ncbi:hypothetical protein LTR08_007397 [Meristemomyces frigidus]|nr:hypothetical protein LTR08_007397 [Meristemomyces frigidus]
MSTTRAPSLLKRAYFKWKTLPLPWRKTFLVGADLAGNTFWVFKDALHAGRWRRIVKYGHNAHYGDVKISPQWHQWLRHTRDAAPSLQEQQADVSRQAAMKQLAAQADARWQSVPSFLDPPAAQQPQPAIGVKDPGGYAGQTEPEAKQGVISGVEDVAKVRAASEGEDTRAGDEGRFKGATREESPWKQPNRGSAGEDWQPREWTPGPAPRG